MGQKLNRDIEGPGKPNAKTPEGDDQTDVTAPKPREENAHLARPSPNIITGAAVEQEDQQGQGDQHQYEDGEGARQIASNHFRRGLLGAEILFRAAVNADP